MRPPCKAAAIAIAVLVGSGVAAKAEPPAALVEDIQGKVTGAEFMDYVVPGQVIKIGTSGSVVLSYLKSCRRETISGIGTVIVGADESKVHLSDGQGREGRMRRQSRACDDKGNQRGRRDRGPRHCASTPRTTAQVTLYGASPIFEAEEPRRADRRAARQGGRAPADRDRRTTGSRENSSILPRSIARWRQAGPMRRPLAPRRSSSASTRRQSRARHRCSGGCFRWISPLPGHRP